MSQMVDGFGNAITSTNVGGDPTAGGKQGLDIAIISGSVTITGTVAVTQSGTWNINNISGTISLPTGAATEATLATIAAIDFATETTLSALNTKIPSGLTVTSNRLLVDGSGVTQPVSGTVAATQSGVWNITNISGTISLPTGAATESTLSTIAGLDFATETTLASILAGQLPDGHNVTVDNATLAVTQSGTWNINNISGTISLPTGAATATNQSTMITALQLIDNIVQTEDSAHVSGHSGVMSLAVRQDTLSNSVSANGDYGSLKLNSTGSLYVEARQATHDNLNLNSNLQIGNTDVSTSNAVPVEENVADGASTSTSSITTTASSVGGVANQVALAIFPIGTGRYYFNVGGTATTSNAYITSSSPLVLENYSGSVSLIRSTGSGSVQITALTRS